MIKIVVTTVSLCFVTHVLVGQETGWKEVAAEIASNNKQLRAHESYLSSRALKNGTMNNMEDMEFDATWLPLGKHDAGHAVELELSQSFELPASYRVRRDYIDQDGRQQQMALAEKRQEILAKAGEYCTSLVYLRKRKEVERRRTEQAEQVYRQVETLYRSEAVGKLDLNKARLNWLQQQYVIEGIDTEIERLLEQLKGLNGGNEVAFSANDYGLGLVLPPLDSLWQEKRTTDPGVLQRIEAEKTAEAGIAVAQKDRLPDFDLGLKYEGVTGEYYAGFTGGMTLPLWNRKNTVKAAEARYVYEQLHSEAALTDLYSAYRAAYERYRYFLAKYNEYKTILGGLDSEELLAKAYELGELTYIEYYMELTFYQDAYDEMLEMEKQLHLLRNELLKHQY